MDRKYKVLVYRNGERLFARTFSAERQASDYGHTAWEYEKRFAPNTVTLVTCEEMGTVIWEMEG